MPIVKERRRFADVLDEEAEIKYQRKMEAWGRDDFSVYKPTRVLGGEQTGGMAAGGEGGGEEVTQEVISSSSVCVQTVGESPKGAVYLTPLRGLI